MPQPNGLSINSAPLDESEDVEPLIQSDAVLKEAAGHQMPSVDWMMLQK